MNINTVSWLNEIAALCDQYNIQLPTEQEISGDWAYTKGGLADRVFGCRDISYDFALPQGVVNMYRDDYEYDIRPWFVMAYPDGHTFGVLFPLTQDAMFALNDIHCQAEESEVEL